MVYGLRSSIWLWWGSILFMVFVEGQVGAGSSLGTTLRHGSRGGSAGNGVGWSGGGFAGRGHDGVQSFGQDSEDRLEKSYDNNQYLQGAAPQDGQMSEVDVSSSATPATVTVMSTATSTVPGMAQYMASATDTPSPAPATSTTMPFEQPSSVANAFPEPPNTLPAPPGIPLALPTSATPTDLPITTASTELNPSSTSDHPTTTTSMTLFITPSPTTDPSVVPIEDSSPSSSTSSPSSPSPSIDTAPLSSATNTTSTISKKAGIGIGIAFTTLFLLSLALIYLLRRRQRNRSTSSKVPGDNLSPQKPQGRGIPNLTAFLKNLLQRSRPNTPPKDDPEWSIESVSKIAILRGGSVRSIRTGVGSRAHSPAPSWPFLNATEKATRLERLQEVSGGETRGEDEGVLSVGIRVESGRDERKDAALTSNPFTPREERGRSWPLVE